MLWSFWKCLQLISALKYLQWFMELFLWYYGFSKRQNRCLWGLRMGCCWDTSINVVKKNNQECVISIVKPYASCREFVIALRRGITTTYVLVKSTMCPVTHPLMSSIIYEEAKNSLTFLNIPLNFKVISWKEHVALFLSTITSVLNFHPSVCM